MEHGLTKEKKKYIPAECANKPIQIIRIKMIVILKKDDFPSYLKNFDANYAMITAYFSSRKYHIESDIAITKAFGFCVY